MHEFIKCFILEPPGHWTCVKPCQIDLPGGHIQVTAGIRFTRGTRFMDVGIAELLDRELARAHPD